MALSENGRRLYRAVHEGQEVFSTVCPVYKIISGGQTGADQGALVAAKQLDLDTGGWMPRGFRTEDGPAPEMRTLFRMSEHPDPTYPPRTRQNVKDADGTIWVGSADSPGYRCTRAAIERYRKPWLNNPTPEVLRGWAAQWDIRILNVAGHRESTHPGTRQQTIDLLMAAFGSQA